jgi:hypothetical protein
MTMPDLRSLLNLLAGNEDDSARQREVLGRLVLDLLMEVEALRRAVMELSARAGPMEKGENIHDGNRHGLTGPRTVYAEAYIDTAWLIHWSAGPSDGWEKLLAEYYSRATGSKWDEWRECVMLKRLGFSEADIAKYKESARAAETCT